MTHKLKNCPYCGKDHKAFYETKETNGLVTGWYASTRNDCRASLNGFWDTLEDLQMAWDQYSNTTVLEAYREHVNHLKQVIQQANKRRTGTNGMNLWYRQNKETIEAIAEELSK